MANNIKGITIEIGGDTTKLDSALKSVNKETGSLKRELKEVEKSLKLDPGNAELLAQKQKILNESIEATNEKLKTLKEAEEQARKAFEAGELPEEKYRALQREIVNTEAELKKLNEEAGKSKISFESVGSSLEKTGAKIEGAGKKLLPVTAAIGAVGAASVAAAKDVDAGYDIIVTKTGATGKALQGLKDQMDNIFADLPTDAETAGIAIGEVNTRFGLTGDALGELSAEFIRFAEINGTDLNNSIDSVDAIMTKFGVDTSETGNVLGLMTKAGQDTGLSMDTLYSALEANGATLKEMGLGLVESVNLMAQFEASGVDAGTALAALKKAQQNATAEGKTLDQALNEQIEAIKGASTETEALQIATELFGKKGAAEMTQAIREGRFSIDDLTGSLGDYKNTVQDTYNETLDPWDEMVVATNNLKLSGAELAKTFLSQLQPVITALVGKVKSFTQWFKNLDDNQKKTITTIAGVVAAIGPLLIIIGKVISIAGTITKTIGTIKTAVTGLNAVLMANPIGLIIAAITAVIAILVVMYNKCEWFRDGVNAIWAAVKDAFFKAFDGIKTFFTETLPNAFKTIVNFIQNNWQGLLLLIVNPFAGAFKLLYDNCETFRQFVDGFVQKIKDFFQKLWDGIVNIFQNVGKWFSDRFTEAYNNITKAFQNIGQWFGQRWTDIKNALSQVATWFQKMFQDAYTNLTNVFKAIGQWFAARWTDIKNALSQVASWFQTTFQNAYTNVTNVFKAIGQWFSARYTDITNAIKGIPEYFRTCFQNGYDAITGVFKGIGDWFKTNVIDKIKSVFDNFNFKSIGENIVNAIKNGISSISLPKLSISWSTSEKKEGDGPLIKIPVPHLTWNALGGIMTKPTIFGMYGGSLQGGGEAGQEAILPLDIFYRRVENYIDSAVERTAFAAAGGTGGGNFIQNNNYYSPKELSPSEAARQTRNATRKMVQTITKGRN